MDREWSTMLDAFEATLVSMRMLLDKLPLTAENMTLREATVHAMNGIKCSRENHGLKPPGKLTS